MQVSSLAIPSASVGSDRAETIPEGAGLVGTGSKQATALQHSAETEQKAAQRLETSAGADKCCFKVKPPKFPQKMMENGFEATAFRVSKNLQQKQLQEQLYSL